MFFEGSVEGRIIPEAYLSAELLHAHVVCDQAFGGNETPLGNKLVEADVHLFLEGLAYCAFADEET